MVSVAMVFWLVGWRWCSGDVFVSVIDATACFVLNVLAGVCCVTVIVVGMVTRL